MNFERVEAAFALIDGDPATVFEIGVRHFEDTPFAQGLSVQLAVLGAAVLGDLERLHRVLEMAESLSPGIFNSSTAGWVEVIIGLVGDGVAEGAAHAESLVERTREDGVLWQEFLILTTVARMLPPDHEARARYRDRIEEIAVPAGALGLWEWARSLIDGTD